MTAREVLKLIKEKNIEMLDLKLIDVPGMWQHVTIPVSEVDESIFETGVAFDGSSVRGFRGIEESDMVMVPDPATAFVDPFAALPTLSMACNVYEPGMVRYSRDPRSIAQKAEEYLKQTGIADVSYWGPELEFFVFDDVRYDSNSRECYYHVDSVEGIWNSGRNDSPNLGYKIRHKLGYFPVAPSDTQADLRSEMVKVMQEGGVRVEMHHHEVATAGQAEIDMRFDSLTRMADKVMTYKYVVKNVARRHGKTATFMPKPLFGDNGSGMHTHQSLFKGELPLFFERGAYANLSELGHYYVGGLLKHAPALLAFTSCSTNSYKRLVPGYEAPVNLVFSKGNRSAAVRIPVASDNPRAVRAEFRPPDSTCNPYLAFAAMLMAGIDGVINRIDPRREGFGPVDKNIYELSPEEAAEIRSVPGSLDEALFALERDHDFLLRGGVFTEDFIRLWIDLKRSTEVDPVRIRPHPYEFYLYYDA